MIRTSYLRVYQSLDHFPAPERKRWSAYPPEDEPSDFSLARRWLISGTLPRGEQVFAPAEGAFVRRIDGEVLVCPWRTGLRMLAGLVAFRGTLPEEIADAFVPEHEARRAADELVALGRRHPELRSHILHANWHVPLRWFAAFGDEERVLTEDRNGLRVRYESGIAAAKDRLDRAISVLEGAWIDDEVTLAVRELAAWLADFPEGCLVELDYGTVARLFSDDDLVEDRSAADVWDCLTALAAGDVVAAGQTFARLTDRWNEVRAKEAVN